MNENSGFSVRGLGWLIAVGVVAFVGTIVLTLFGDELSIISSAGTNTASKSAIGHKAFVELLRRNDIDVFVSRSYKTNTGGKNRLLLLAEPPTDWRPDMAALFAAERVLIVLPKWIGFADPSARGFVATVSLQQKARVEAVLKRIAPEATISREEPTTSDCDTSDMPAVSIDKPQLMSLVGKVVCPSGNLLSFAKANGRGTIWILSDPDVMNNHGLDNGDNAAFMLAAIRRLLPDGGTVVVDETIHGLAVDANPWTALLAFPALLVTLQGAMAIAVLFWAASARFGAPAREEVVATPFASDTPPLVANGARLLVSAGHGGAILRRYARMTRQAAVRHLHPPAGLKGRLLIEWLDRVAARRGVSVSLTTLLDEVADAADTPKPEPRRILRVARRLYRWKEEMTDGSRSR